MNSFIKILLISGVALFTSLGAFEVVFGSSSLTSQKINESDLALSPIQTKAIHHNINKRVAEAKVKRERGLIAAEDITIAANLDGLPSEKNGFFPIQIPIYDGIEQLLLINDKWVIVALTNFEDVSKEIAKLSKDDPVYANIDFIAAQKTWMESWKVKKPDWVLKKKVDAITKKYLGQARVNASEDFLGSPDCFRITSSEDPNYKTYKNPDSVSRFMISLGGEFATGWHPHLAGLDITYALYSYLELPTPMQEGSTYTITLMNGKAVTFTYDELTLVSRAIHVNQVGYLPEAKKYAYIGAYLQDRGPLELDQETTFSIIDAEKGQAVYSGKVTLRASNPRFSVKPGTSESPDTRPLVSGENIYEIDFSPVSVPGTYFITVSGVGRSWPFTIANNAMAEAFYTAFRGMYHQRCGIAIGHPYTPWPRQRCHYSSVYECDYIPIFFDPLNRQGTWQDFDMVGGTMNKSVSTADATGGWHDAGDWDKRIQHYAVVFDLLSLYELKPNNFADGQMNIPESGNGIPDVLDEVEYGLLVWKKSMSDAGGVAGRLETSTHPSIDDPNYPYAYSLRTRWSSLLFAAGAAWYAHLIKPFDAEKSTEWERLAKKAYAFGTDPKSSLGTKTIYPRYARGTGAEYAVAWTEEDYFNVPFLIAAKMRLSILTNETQYLEGLEHLLKEMTTPYSYKNLQLRMLPANWPFTNRDGSLWIYSSLFHPSISPQLQPATIQFWKDQYLKLADTLASLNDAEYYRRSRQLYDDKRMAWGTDVMTNDAKVLLFAYHLTNNAKYKQAALYNIDYMLGGNPSGMCWTTGIGYVYPIPIHHRVSTEDGIRDPVPGIALYGPTETNLKAFNQMWSPNDPAGVPIRFLKPEQYAADGNVVLPRLRNWVAHPVYNVDQNEFTIWETNSSGVWVFGYLLDENWQAPEFVKNRKPRDPRVLFGQYYLP